MIYIIQDDKGEYDDYHIFNVAVLIGKKDVDLDKLATTYYTRKAADYAKVRTKGMPRHLKPDREAFVQWLIDKHGFKRAAYKEWLFNAVTETAPSWS